MSFAITGRTPSLLYVGQIIADIPALSLFQNGLSDESERFYIPINPIFPHFSLYTLSTLRFEILPASTKWKASTKIFLTPRWFFFHHRLSCEWGVIFVFFFQHLGQQTSISDRPTKSSKADMLTNRGSKELTLSNWLKRNLLITLKFNNLLNRNSEEQVKMSMLCSCFSHFLSLTLFFLETFQLIK